MAVVTYGSRAKETTTTTGTGTVTLAGAMTGYQTLVAATSDGAYVPYTIVGTSGAAEGEWETGYGTVTDAASDTLSRTVVEDSSNSGSLVNFSAGTKEVFITLHATEAASRNRAMDVIGVYDPSAASELDIDISGYEAIELRGWLAPASDGTLPYLLVSNDGGATFETGASYYAWSFKYTMMAEAASVAEDGDEADAQIQLGNSVGNAAGEAFVFGLDILSPNESSAETVVTWQGSSITASGDRWYSDGSGRVTTTEANDAIRLKFASGNIASGHVVAYGYKNAATSYPSSWQGALVKFASDESMTGGASETLAWDSEVYDEGGWHESVTNPSRLTVPAGVSRVRITIAVVWQSINDSYFRIFLYKGGSEITTGGGIYHYSYLGENGVVPSIHVSTPVLEVSAGDYFEVNALIGVNATVEADRSWFAIEKVT